MKQLEAMCSGIQRALGADAERKSMATSNLARARTLTDRFALIHRTGLPGTATLQDILSNRRLHAKPPCTQREVDCGVERALYFFLGCAAYPEGAVAFLAPHRVLERMPASFSPFDTGSLSKYSCLRDQDAPWAETDKHAFLASHLGDGADAIAFSAEYVAAHFHDAADYVRGPQQSEPDFPTYHELVSTSGDRRAWSIEVQLHGDLELDQDHLEAIVLGQPDLYADIPDDLLGTVVIAEDEGAITPMIHQLIIQEASS